MASKPLKSLRSLWPLASTAFFWAALTRLKISSVCKSIGVVHISFDKNHVESIDTDGSLPDLGDLFDFSVFEMKCTLFNLGIPAFLILEICLVCAARFGHSFKLI